MAQSLSGVGPRNPAAGGATVRSSPPRTPMPARRSTGGRSVGQLQSTPKSRSAASSRRREIEIVTVGIGADEIDPIEGEELVPADTVTQSPGEAAVARGTTVGTPPADTGVSERVNRITDESNTAPVGDGEALTAEEREANREAVEQRKKGVLGCPGKAQTAPSGPGPECGECGPIDCLQDLLRQLLPVLPDSAKGILCSMAASAEKAAKRQMDNAGNAILNAATDLASADANRAPLGELNRALGRIDPGAIANCFGAQELIDNVQGQLRRANNVIADAEAGVQDAIAEKFNQGIAKTQQWSAVDGIC